jgi:alpha/beta superfamily hydrolase
MSRVFLLIVAFGLALSSCLKLDPAIYLHASLEEYKFENYTGSVDCSFEDDSYDIPEEYQNLLELTSTIDDADEVKIYALYLGDMETITEDTIIVYCHGQWQHMDFYYPRAKLLANCGGKNRFGVIMMDYRAYGMSEGETSEPGMSADVQACLQWLEDQGVKAENTVIYGFSLGTIPACDIAAYNDDFKPSKLVLEAPMASAEFLMQFSTGIDLCSDFVFELKAENMEKIKDVDQPFLWLHGIDDQKIAIPNGEAIYDNYQGVYKEAHRVPGALHGTGGVPQTLGYEEYLSILEKFIVR